MRAMRFGRFGGPEVLEEADVPDPSAGPGETDLGGFTKLSPAGPRHEVRSGEPPCAPRGARRNPRRGRRLFDPCGLCVLAVPSSRFRLVRLGRGHCGLSCLKTRNSNGVLQGARLSAPLS